MNTQYNVYTVISILAPKQIETYMDSISNESFELVNRLMRATEEDGSVDPMQHFMLQALNVIYKVSFGDRFEAIDDPKFHELSSLIEETMTLGGFENDLASFLPILSIVDYFAGSQVKMKRFIKLKRDPVFKRLLKEAMAREGPNVVKSLGEQRFEFTEEDKIVLMCKCIFIYAVHDHSSHDAYIQAISLQVAQILQQQVYRGILQFCPIIQMYSRKQQRKLIASSKHTAACPDFRTVYRCRIVLL